MVWSPVLLAQYIITRCIVKRPPPANLRGEYLRYFETCQTSEGGWGLHAESRAYLFVTSLVYVAQRMMGVEPDNPHLTRARLLINSLGSPLAAPSWGKFWLALCNVYEYEGLFPVPPELWLLPRRLPGHPLRWYCHTRLIYLGMSVLYGLRFRRPVDELCLALRRELYSEPYENLDFRAGRRLLVRRDTFTAPSVLLIGCCGLLRLFERMCPGRLRRRGLNAALRRIEFEQRTTSYAALSPVNGLLNVLALYAADPGHPSIEPSLDGMEHWRWRDDTHGIRYCGGRSQVWDTAFVVQAALASGKTASITPALVRGARWLRENQLRSELDGGRSFGRDTRTGGWCFSDKRHGWPVSDTTAEALSALLVLHENGVEKAEQSSAEDAVRFILSRQNRDGGFGSYERRREGTWLERLNPSEMFGNCMVEHSYIECTASALEALIAFARVFPASLLRKMVLESLRRGERFLVKAQEQDGAWRGFWGVNYTYGTFFAVRGLAACGRNADDPVVRRACDWLIAHQKADGGWGEHWTGSLQARYIEHPRSQVIMTAWALLALLFARDGRREPIDRGMTLLLSRQDASGSWPREAVAGVFFNTAMLHYDLYREYFPLWALGLHHRRFKQS